MLPRVSGIPWGRTTLGEGDLGSHSPPGLVVASGRAVAYPHGPWAPAPSLKHKTRNKQVSETQLGSRLTRCALEPGFLHTWGEERLEPRLQLLSGGTHPAEAKWEHTRRRFGLFNARETRQDFRRRPGWQRWPWARAKRSFNKSPRVTFQ